MSAREAVYRYILDHWGDQAAARFVIHGCVRDSGMAFEEVGIRLSLHGRHIERLCMDCKMPMQLRDMSDIARACGFRLEVGFKELPCST